MSPLRVLTIGHSYVVGLNQGVAATIATDPEIDMTLVAPRSHRGDLHRLHLDRVSSPDYDIVGLRTSLNRWNHTFWYDSRRLRRLIRDGDYDVVHLWEEPYTVSGFQIAKLVGPTRARLFFWTAQNLVKRYPWPFRAFERAVLGRADAWVACGRLVFDAMVSKGFPADRGRIIGMGVDTDRFQPLSDTERDVVRAQMGLTAPVVGYLGRFVRDKGIHVLLAALEQVEHEWTLLAVGSGPEEATMRAWAERHGWSDRLRIVLAAHDDVPRYLGVMDLLAAPSQTTSHWKEQFGRMVTEAFACRVAVVASDSGEIPYVAGDAGRVVPEGDVARWTETIDRLLADPTERDRLAAAGHVRCQERFSLPSIAAEYRRLYHELAPGGPR